MSSSSKARQQRRRAHAQTSGRRRTPGQVAAFRELDAVRLHPLVLAAEDLHSGKGQLALRIRISTSGMQPVASGLPISPDFEDVHLWFLDTYPNEPPAVLVDHERFLDHPHVLVGRMLCIYLDTEREWHPALGLAGVVDRLVRWFQDAAADRFDRRAALYHPIGGLPPSPRVPGLLVVRTSSSSRDQLIARATVTLRSPHRWDLAHWGGRRAEDTSATPALVLRTRRAISRGLVGVSRLGDLAAAIEHAGGPTQSETFAACARLAPHVTDNLVRVVVEVAHPADPAVSYLACAIGPMPASVAARPGLASQLPELPIGWTRVSDERPQIAMRRDQHRPTSNFLGKTVELWGCGGLGSWMGEFVARAGAAHVIVRDRGGVDGGLLVRQNYIEEDVGLAKAEQLAARLRTLRDGIEVTAMTESALTVLAESYTPTCDVLIDATINVTVAARLDAWARANPARPLIAQVATDPRSATLGLLVVASPGIAVGPASVDDATWATIRNDPTFERFHGFWTSPSKADQLVPSMGCSTPTFHGSAADLACLAGSLVSLLASHMGVTESGTHLVESSHARGELGGGHRYVAYEPS